MKIISTVGAFICGGIIGSAVTYFLVNESANKKIQENNDAMWEMYNKEMAQIKKNSEATEEDSHISTEERRVNAKVTPYNKMSSIEEMEDEEKDHIVVLAEQESPIEAPEDIFEIGFAEFEDGEPTFDKIQLTYYEGDQTLTDELDEPIDITDAVNEDCIIEFENSDENVMYFRNLKRETDYEIVRALGEYKDRLGDI